MAELKKHHLPDLEWSARAGASAVDELLIAKLITAEQADLARKIVSQDLYIQLVSGIRPQDEVS
jgi:hypothetical protein